MLPNHAPLQVAEQFGTLASLYPGRIDLGLGRAPGTDQAATRALRRYYQGADEFPNDVVELLQYFEQAAAGPAGARGAGRRCRGGGVDPRFESVRRAARGGTRACLMRSPRTSRPTCWSRRWRSIARSSGRRPASQQPHVMLALNVVAVETDAEAKTAVHYPSSWASSTCGVAGRGWSSRRAADITAVDTTEATRRCRPGAGMRGDRLAGHRGAGNRAFIARHWLDELMLDRRRVRPRARMRSFELAAGVLL